MSWLDEVQEKIKRKNQILFAKDSPFLQDIAALIEEQNHKTLILWALEFADEISGRLSLCYPDEGRFMDAVTVSREWAEGKVKMPAAKHAILQVHAVAKEIESPEDIALCHAIGQACGVVHTTGHALGLPIYELTAIIRHCGVDSCKVPVEKRKELYIKRIHHWSEHYDEYPCDWADFLQKESLAGK